VKREGSYLGLPEDVSARARRGRGRSTGLEQWLLRRLREAMGNPAVRVTLWDGYTAGEPGARGQPTLVIGDRSALWRLLTNPGLNFGDDYSAGRLNVEGSLTALLEAVYRARPNPADSTLAYRLAFSRRLRRRPNSLAGSRGNIHHHYDIGNDFYRMWLDPDMAYTCAYYPQPDMDLGAAQRAKMEHICRKLRLRPGQTVVEAGCGWGGLSRYMASHHGVRVAAYNISPQQITYARQRAQADGLDHRIDYIEDDYRNIRGDYDAFVSVGMLEHVGPEHFGELGAVIRRCLKPAGLGLIHSIGQNCSEPMNAWVEKRIFPGAYPPTLAEMTTIFEPNELTVLDVENLRLHYARTLQHWLERFEGRRDDVRQMFDEKFVRAWRLYLAASIANFSTGWLQLFQVAFTGARNNALPESRAHLYQNGPSFQAHG